MEFSDHFCDSLTFPLRVIALLCIALALQGTVFSDDSGSIQNEDTTSEGNHLEKDDYWVPMVRAEDPPTIDGYVKEECWSDAPVISNFTQVQPNEGSPPSERTEILLLYSSDYIYVGIRAFDSQPDNITARVMQRDGSMRFEDSVSMTFDTFHDFRNAYYFEINALGALRDALIRSGKFPNYNWDGIWDGKAVMDKNGWSAELAIPTKTLSFNPHGKNWGFNVERSIQRNRERVRWSAPYRNKSIRELGSSGMLTDITGLQQGMGLDFVPYANLKATRDQVLNDSNVELKSGFDLFYNITPAITAALTVNTDFAEAEVDDRRVNLSRFELFFPEKRKFFLQDAELFRFGGLRRSPVPFFSRRIGLDADNQPLDIRGGIKVTGRMRRVNFGFLDVQVDEAINLDSKNLAVARATVNVLEESQVGMIYTHGDPLTNNDNSLIGADFTYRTSKLFGANDDFETNFFIQKSSTTGFSDDQGAIGGSVRYPNDKITLILYVEMMDENYMPALGFVDESGVRDYFLFSRYRVRPKKKFDSIDYKIDAHYRSTLDGEVVSSRFNFPDFRITNKAKDYIDVSGQFHREHLFEPFEIVDGVIIPIGDYEFRNAEVRVRTARERSLSGNFTLGVGEFYDGDRFRFRSEIIWKPSALFNTTFEYQYNNVDLPVGDFITRVVQFNLNINFSPKLYWNITQQYDNVSDNFGINSRIRWNIRPGNDIYVVFNQGVDTADGHWHPSDRQLNTKISWTLRF